MSRHRSLPRFIAALIVLVSPLAQANNYVLKMVPIDRKHLPQSALQEGSLANNELEAQARTLVTEHAAKLGCRANTIAPYLLRLPYGKVGERRWQEVWQIKGCGDGAINTQLTFHERSKQIASITISEGNDD